MRRAAVFPAASSVGVACSPRVGVPSIPCVVSSGWWVCAGVIGTASDAWFVGACWGTRPREWCGVRWGWGGAGPPFVVCPSWVWVPASAVVRFSSVPQSPLQPLPGSWANCTQGPQPGLASAHSPPPTAEPSLERRGNAPRALNQDWRGTKCHHQQQTPPTNGRELPPGPSGRIGEGPPTSTSSRPELGMAGNCTHASPTRKTAHATGRHKTHPHKHKH